MLPNEVHRKYSPFVTFVEFKTKDLINLRVLSQLRERPISYNSYAYEAMSAACTHLFKISSDHYD